MGLVQLLDIYDTYGGYNTASTLSNNDIGSVIAGIFAGFAVLIVLGLVAAIVVLIAKYKLFKKMNVSGWKSLIPMVNNYVQMEATGVDQRWLLIVTFGSCASIIPVIGSLAYAVAMIYFAILMNVSLARSFGKSDGFAVGLILLSPVFLCILAFGSSEYVGKKPMNDIIFKNKDNNSSTAPAAVGGKKCPNCGADNNESVKFCTSCGTEIK